MSYECLCAKCNRSQSNGQSKAPIDDTEVLAALRALLAITNDKEFRFPEDQAIISHARWVLARESAR